MNIIEPTPRLLHDVQVPSAANNFASTKGSNSGFEATPGLGNAVSSAMRKLNSIKQQDPLQSENENKY